MSERKRNTRSVTSLVATPLMEDEVFLQHVDDIFRGLKIEQQLIKLRKERGYSQSEFARILGVSQPLIAKMEAEPLTNIELKKLIRVVAALNGSLELHINPKMGEKKKLSAAATAGGLRRF